MSNFNYREIANLREFLSTDAEALQNASLLPGGQPALRKTIALFDDVSSASALNGRLRIEVKHLHALLTLTRVDDPDRPGSDYLALIDPLWPVFEDISLLTDQ